MEDIFQWCREGNTLQIRVWLDDTENDLNHLKDTINVFVFDVLGLLNISQTSSTTDKLTSAVEVLIKLRREARVNKDFALSDKIRDELSQIGIHLQDGKDGTTFTTN